MRQTTSSEFADWQEYMAQEEEHGFHRLDHYFAQLTCEVVRSRVKDPNSVKPQQFMLTFRREKPKAAPVSRKEAKARIAASKAAWGMATGMKLG